ncbi:hypothetical protein [Dysgonomonas sp. 25]|uniref:hypothetical protein n=1 Tax=Dysgonomonas sp. 25 TaxID=2302933 RepID=UPI0013D7A49B|nr:hypothetical protein [Dysgonomonas sp. 25]NDV68627.1 hypothetical protein [Dysgonomonas sp. 25]
MKLKIIKGYHLTAAERKSITKMLERGWTKAINLPKTKSYKITNRTPEQIDVKIGTKAVWTIGDVAKWKYQYLTIEYKNE